jgi:hypothetical protein
VCDTILEHAGNVLQRGPLIIPIKIIIFLRYNINGREGVESSVVYRDFVTVT